MIVKLLTLCAFVAVCVSARNGESCPEKCNDKLDWSMTNMASLISDLKYVVTGDLMILTDENLQLKDRLQNAETKNANLEERLEDMEARNAKLHGKMKKLEEQVNEMQAIFNRLDFKRWDNWTEWSSCSGTCGKGVTTRRRKCIGDVPMSYSCVGDEEEVDEEECELAKCVVKSWASWSSWSNCPVSCGVGTITRKRICIGDVRADDSCVGGSEEKKECIGTRCGEDCPIRRGRTCFIILAFGSREIEVKHRLACRKKGGELGNVYDRQHLESLRSYLSEKGYLSGVITRMTYKSSEGIRLSDGSKIELPWLPGYPKNDRRYTSVHVKLSDGSKAYSNIFQRYIGVNEGGKVEAGMINAHENERSRYSLCEVDIANLKHDDDESDDEDDD